MIILRHSGNKELPYNKENVQKYKSQDNLLRHARTGKDCSGIILVNSSDVLIGYIGWQGETIIALEVTHKFRSQGYGEYLLKKAINSGCTKLTVDKKNTPAISLYRKLGFEIAEDNGSRYLMSLKEKREKLFSKTPTLYFVSPDPDLEKEIIDPIIPKNFLVNEGIINNKLPRIRLYENVGDAIAGTYLDQTPEKKLTVYQAQFLRKESLVEPDFQDVPFGYFLKEWWYLRNMKPKRIADIELSGKVLRTQDYHYGQKQKVAKLKWWEWKEILKPWEKKGRLER